MRLGLVSLLWTPILAACGDDAADPTLAVSADRTTLLPGESVDLTVTVTGFELVDPAAAPPNRDGQGHYHVYLDDATAMDYLAADSTPTRSVTIPDATPPGAHSLRVVLVNNDHSLLEGGPEASVDLMIGYPPPTMSFTMVASPDPAVVGGLLTFTVTVTNFVLDPNIGGTNDPPHGHYHVTVVDSGFYKASSDMESVFTIVDANAIDNELEIPPGTHEIRVSLQNNDHSDLDPPVAQSMTLTVQ